MNGRATVFYIGETKPPKWLYRDFILGYFGNKVSVAQKGYHNFESLLINDYDSPLNEVVGSTLLGSPGFIALGEGYGGQQLKQ